MGNYMGLQQLNFDGKNKVEVAIERIQQYQPHEDYYLGNSGGKDSRAVDDLARMAGARFKGYYNVSPIDPPEIRQFLKETFPDLIWERHAKGFWQRFMTEGPPMRQMRWCCGLIKEAGGVGRVKILGMRTQESSSRKNYKLFTPHRSQPNTYWLLPIYDWSDAEVWEYIRMRKLSYCSLYDEGFTRLGCVLCPFESPTITQRNLARFPTLAKNWHRAFERYYQIRIDRGTPLTWQTVEEYWQWWLSRK